MENKNNDYVYETDSLSIPKWVKILFVSICIIVLTVAILCIKLEKDDTVYVADISLWSELPLLSVGDNVTFKSNSSGNITSFITE